MKNISIRQRLSLQNVGRSLRLVLQRFPVTVCLLLCLTVLLSAEVVYDISMSWGLGCLTYFLTAGMLIDFAATLYAEERQEGQRIIRILPLVLWAAYCLGIYVRYDNSADNITPSFFLGNAAWITAVALAVPFVAFPKEKSDLKSWHFMMSLCPALLISGIASWVMAGGLEGLIFGTAALFDLKVMEHLPLIIIILCAILLFGLLFLALIPQAEKKHNDTDTMPSFLKNIVSWLLLPLLGCYILVLYAYGISILVRWELPKGMISWLVSAVMAGYLLCYTLLYPKVYDRRSWQSRLLSQWLPTAIFPLLVLMTVGVIRRFADYGITPARLYLLTALLWFYAVCIIMLATKEKRFRWIFLSFAVLFILSSGHPFNYYRLYKPLLAARIERTIAEKQLTVPMYLYSISSNPSLVGR